MKKLDRKELITAAKMLNLPAKGKNEELKAAIDAKIALMYTGVDIDPDVVHGHIISTEHILATKSKEAAKGGSGRGVHPITGELV